MVKNEWLGPQQWMQWRKINILSDKKLLAASYVGIKMLDVKKRTKTWLGIRINGNMQTKEFAAAVVWVKLSDSICCNVNGICLKYSFIHTWSEVKKAFLNNIGSTWSPLKAIAFFASSILSTICRVFVESFTLNECLRKCTN